MAQEATRLMTAAGNGDAEAFDTLTRTVGPRAYSLAWGLVGSSEDARDICQESLARVWANRAAYDPAQPFLPWFQRILRNTAISLLRKKRVRTVLEQEGEDGAPGFSVIDPRPDPAREAQARETTRAWQTAFQRLSTADREILALRVRQELSYREIAATLGIKEGTVMSRLFYARQRLREILRELSAWEDEG